MSITDSLLDVLITFGKLALVIGVFYFSKFYVQRSRKDMGTPPAIIEQIVVYIAAGGIIAFASWAVTNFEGFNVSLSFLLLLPCVYGLSVEFRRDSKLTTQEREHRNIKIHTEDFKNRKTY